MAGDFDESPPTRGERATAGVMCERCGGRAEWGYARPCIAGVAGCKGVNAWDADALDQSTPTSRELADVLTRQAQANEEYDALGQIADILADLRWTIGWMETKIEWLELENQTMRQRIATLGGE